MAQAQPSDEHEALVRSFSGFGVDEKSMINILGKWHPEQRQLFRQTSSNFFKPDGHKHGFERWLDDHIKQLEVEFSRFKKAVVLRAMHPWERDARWAHFVISKEHPDDILVEIACTRSSEELLGARRAYHALFHHSLEEDVAYHVKEAHSNLLIALVSAFRYEGSVVDDNLVKLEAKILGNAIRNPSINAKLTENVEIIRILSTRSKPHLKATFNHYKEIFGSDIYDDLSNDPTLQQVVLCLDSPHVYFSKALEDSLKGDADKYTKDALTRVVVTRSDHDMKEIKEEFQKRNGVSLEEKIKSTIHGNYKDFLITLVGGQE